MLSIGHKAPNFSLSDSDNKLISLSDYKGTKVLLWFFPKANTPGCTAEGCTLTDHFSQFKKQNITIMGISADKITAQDKFKQKYNFPFIMLCDEQKEAIKKYQAWGHKKFMGKEYEGILRISYLIDEKGYIEKTYEKVNTKTHAQDVLTSIQ